jgi:hypothetical protein
MDKKITCGYCGKQFSEDLETPKCKVRKGKWCSVRELFEDIKTNNNGR